MVPHVTAFAHVHIVFAALYDDDALQTGAFFGGFIDYRFQGEDAAAPVAAVGGDDHFGAGVVDPVGESRGAKAAEHDAVNCADAGARQHRHHRFGDQRHVNGDHITLLNALTFEDVGEFGDFGEQFAIGKGAGVARFALPHERGLIATTLFDLIIQAVVRDIGFTADEPLDERLVPFHHLVPGFEPVQLARHVAPKGFGVVQRLTVEAVVFGFVGEFGGGLKCFVRGKATALLHHGLDTVGHGRSFLWGGATGRTGVAWLAPPILTGSGARIKVRLGAFARFCPYHLHSCRPSSSPA